MTTLHAEGVPFEDGLLADKPPFPLRRPGSPVLYNLQCGWCRTIYTNVAKADVAGALCQEFDCKGRHLAIVDKF